MNIIFPPLSLPFSIFKSNDISSCEKDDQDDLLDDYLPKNIFWGENILFKENVNNHLVILDWDDTLFPTSWLSTIKNINPELNNYELYNQNKVIFNELWYLVKNLIKTMSTYAQVKIVSNGSNEWIKKISQVYYIGHREFMNKHNVSIQSAREYKNNKFIFKNQGAWKVNLFRDIFENWKKKNELFYQRTNKPQPILKILGIGDQDNDRIAIWSIDKHDSVKRKTLKFVECPNIAFLKNQLINLTLKAKDILLSDDEINLKFENN